VREIVGDELAISVALPAVKLDPVRYGSGAGAIAGFAPIEWRWAC
jgi:hypothetical protein